MQKMWVQSLDQEDPLEEEMVIYSSILTGKSHGQRSLAGHSPWGRKSRTLLSDYTTKEINKWVIFAGSISVN